MLEESETSAVEEIIVLDFPPWLTSSLGLEGESLEEDPNWLLESDSKKLLKNVSLSY